jgi:hypothetical protein
MTQLPDSIISILVPAGAGRTLTADLHRRFLYGVRSQPPALERKPPKPNVISGTRKPRLRTLVKQAEAATGKPVTAITLPDGTRIDFTKAEQQQGNEVDEWIAKHADKTQRH